MILFVPIFIPTVSIVDSLVYGRTFPELIKYLDAMAPTPYPVMDVSGWSIANLEPQGGGPNTWLYSDSRRWLFKPVSTVSRFEHFPPAKPPTLVEHAREGLRLAGKLARTFWLTQLQHLTRSDVEAVVHRMPGLSDVTRNFIVDLLVINRRRLLDEC